MERRRHHHRRAVLVVVQHRPVEALYQRGLDLEAGRRTDVFQLDRAEARRDGDDRLDHVLRIVTTHRRINIRPTSCPGKYFPERVVMTAYNR